MKWYQGNVIVTYLHQNRNINYHKLPRTKKNFDVSSIVKSMSIEPQGF